MQVSERIVTQRADRLAEMVWHLTDCHPLQALTAVGEPATHEDPLVVVARAICRIRHIDLRERIDLRDKPRQEARPTAAQP